MREIANVTATYDGEQVEDHDDIGRGAFDSLLHSGDEIVIHEVHDQDQLDDLKERYSDDWEETVVFADDGEDQSEEQDTDESLFASDDSECRHVDCEEEPKMAAKCDTGQTKYYCGDHAGGTHAGHAYVEEWVEA